MKYTNAYALVRLRGSWIPSISPTKRTRTHDPLYCPEVEEIVQEILTFIAKDYNRSAGHYRAAVENSDLQLRVIPPKATILVSNGIQAVFGSKNNKKARDCYAPTQD